MLRFFASLRMTGFLLCVLRRCEGPLAWRLKANAQILRFAQNDEPFFCMSSGFAKDLLHGG